MSELNPELVEIGRGNNKSDTGKGAKKDENNEWK
jgi:hypothetical protein